MRSQQWDAQVRDLSEFPFQARTQILGVLTDIDDTLTSDGQLTASAYAALESLQRAGFQVIPVTGRPAGWCDHIARMWPVDAVVGENGAFWMRYDKHNKKLNTVFAKQPDADRQIRMQTLANKILEAVPGCALASDQFCRVADLAIDFCEDVPALPPSAVQTIVQLMHEAGMRAKVSSIHVNGWWGEYDKLSTTRRMMQEEFCIHLDQASERNRWVFVGDSPNDSPMFGYFENSVGVTNVLDFVDQLTSFPSYITPARAGSGFLQLAQALLAARC